MGKRLLAMLAALAATSALAETPEPRLSLGLDTASYFASSRIDQALELGLRGGFEGQAPWGPGASLGAQGSVQSRFVLDAEQGLALEVPEAFAWAGRKAPQATDERLAIGRKLHRWSRLDEEWELGLWQPRFRWDYLHPTAVGLTGLFAELKRKSVRVNAFASFFYVPERGATVWSDRGALRSSSPWFVSPPRLARFAGVATPVAYGLDVPPLGEIVFRPSGAVQVELGEKEGPWLSAAYARKPVNQLVFGVSGHYALAPELIQATIHPRVLEHDLVSVEGGYQAGDVGLWLAFLLERPIRDETPAEWQTQEVSLARAVSPGVSVALGRESGVSVSYLGVSGGNAPDRGGMLASGASASSFEQRYPFANAVKLRGFASLPGPWGRRLSGRSSILVDLGSAERSEPGRGMIWSSELRWASREERGIAVAVGGDVLAADSSTGDESFIARYRANHRVHAGVSYAF